MNPCVGNFSELDSFPTPTSRTAPLGDVTKSEFYFKTCQLWVQYLAQGHVGEHMTGGARNRITVLTIGK